MGLLDDPNRMSMILNGLGLLGSKYEDQAARYSQNANRSLLQRSAQQADAKRLEQMFNQKQKGVEAEYYRSQIGLNKAKELAEGLPPSGFDTKSMMGASGNLIARLAARKQNGEQLTQEEENQLQYAMAYSTMPKVIQTQSGPVNMPGMNLDFLNTIQQPNQTGDGIALPTPAVPTPISEDDPFKAQDVAQIKQAEEFYEKMRGMTSTFDVMREDLKLFPSGADAKARMLARQAGSVIDAGDKKVLAAAERLDKNFAKGISANMEFLKGAMSDSEREFTRQFSLSMGTSPEGNLAYMAFLEGVKDRASKRSGMMRDYYRKHKKLDGFDDVWEQFKIDNPVPFPEIGGQEPDSEYEALLKKHNIE